MESFTVLGAVIMIEIAELFTNSIHNICHKDYTKEQSDACANPVIVTYSWFS